MLEYNDEKHEASYNGVAVPSVTTVLPKVNFYMPESELAIKRENGKERHEMVKLYLDTKHTYDDPFLIMIDEWLKSHKKLTGEMIHHEKKFFSKRHLFWGTPDMVFEDAIIDLKSTLYAPKIFALQMAGYAVLMKEHGLKKIKKWIVLYPSADRSFTMKEKNVYNDKAEDVFIALVRKWHLEKTVELYLKG